jgi:hypothetical protein
MVRLRLALIACFLAPSVAWAQRDPPLLECYLPSITIRHAEGGRLSLELVLKKETGATEHREHQMYLLAYLLDDEEEVLEIAADASLLDKTKGADAKLFLDVLLDKGLVTILETKVAKRQGFSGQDVSGKYVDGSKAARDKADFLKLNAFEYSFAPQYIELFKKISKLKHFRNEDPPAGQIGIYKHRFKMLVFVPVNDCKYASEVGDGIRGKNDYGLKDSLRPTTPILYCRPLPYEFTFRRDSDVGTVIYIQ